MQKYLPAALRQDKVSASAAGYKKQPLSRVSFVQDYRGSKKLSMRGLREDGRQLRLRQSREKPGAEMRGKRHHRVARQIALAVHSSLVPASLGPWE